MPLYVLQLAMPEPPIPTSGDGFSVTFPFFLVPHEAVGTPLQSASSTSGRITAKITRSLLVVWKLPPEVVLKVMSYVLREHVAKELGNVGQLPNDTVVEFSTYNYPGACPFDLALLEDLPGSAISVAINRPIGFVHGA